MNVRPRHRGGAPTYESQRRLLFWEHVRRNPRPVLLFVLIPACAAVGALREAFTPGVAMVLRVGWIGVALVMVVAAVSYLLRFTAPLTGERWTSTRTRRLARSLLRFSWVGYLAMFGVACIYLAATRLLR